jgi:hypothetical protein
MIETTEVDGRPAIVAYLDDQFAPTDKEHATLVKVIFTDEQGGSMFLTSQPE